uniref:Uncharacterized protein n=1 Tax=Schistosoma mansoni TaxID=6183 RepID=A0A5K4FBD8_SCHMA
MMNYLIIIWYFVRLPLFYVLLQNISNLNDPRKAKLIKEEETSSATTETDNTTNELKVTTNETESHLVNICDLKIV